jgi:autotransporter-associated beta strand protein
VTISPVAQLVWDGTVNGSWDVGATANWKTNAYYQETNGVGPAVVFDDSATGSNTAISLNAMVTPVSVVVNNSSEAYSIGGTGGIAGGTGLLKEGAGTFVLGGNNTYTGGTTINAGTLALSAQNNVSMAYALNGGAFKVSVPSPGTSVKMSSLTISSATPQFTFDFENLTGTIVPAIDVAGTLTMNGNVAVNVSNLNLSAAGVAVLFRYAGLRNGTGSFVAGAVPQGLVILDDALSQQVLAYQPGPRVIVPSLNTNEVVVAVATPQEFGARGDGITDDSAAFQNAINAVYNSGGSGGGVIFVPNGDYAFYTNISLPTGVSLHGDWADWVRKGTTAVGTTFKIYYGAGNTNDAPFIYLNRSTALKGVNIWYPDQNASAIVGYPFSIGVGGKCGVMNVALVNSYQGIQSAGGAQHVL